MVLRLAARAPDVEAFIKQYSRYLHDDEIFIVTSEPQPPGTRVRFCLQLASGEPLIEGKGTVTRVQAKQPNQVPGMQVAFVPLDERSRAIIARMQFKREAVAQTSPPSAAAAKPHKMPPPPPPAALARSTAAPKNSEPPTPAAPSNAADTKPAMEPLPPAPDIATASAVEETAPKAADLPANPFCEVSDGAIEYFVEWSLQQSTSAHPESHANFSNVSMARPRMDRARLRQMVPLACVAVGIIVGWVAKSFSRAPRPIPPKAALVAPPAVEAVKPRVEVKKAEHVEGAANVQPPIVPVATVRREADPEPAEKRSPAPAATSASVPLAISSRPSGASVAVDGKDVGHTPVELKVTPGSHEVSVAKVRYATVTSSVTAPGKLALVLKRPGGTLVVDSEPSQADVVIGGKVQGKTPLQVELPAFKRYKVQVAFATGRTWSQNVYLKAPSTELHAHLSDAGTTARR